MAARAPRPVSLAERLEPVTDLDEVRRIKSVATRLYGPAGGRCAWPPFYTLNRSSDRRDPPTWPSGPPG
jgi:hypothetical protein